eukprot:jgi/Chrzof1/4795/UNPLg00799.t1
MQTSLHLASSANEGRSSAPQLSVIPRLRLRTHNMANKVFTVMAVLGLMVLAGVANAAEVKDLSTRKLLTGGHPPSREQCCRSCAEHCKEKGVCQCATEPFLTLVGGNLLSLGCAIVDVGACKNLVAIKLGGCCCTCKA